MRSGQSVHVVDRWSDLRESFFVQSSLLLLMLSVDVFVTVLKRSGLVCRGESINVPVLETVVE